MGLTRSVVDSFRYRLRPYLGLSLVVVLLFAVWVGLGTPGWPTRYQACPDPIGDFNGVCLVDGDLDGDQLFKHEQGLQCGKGSLLPSGEEFWTGQNCL